MNASAQSTKPSDWFYILQVELGEVLGTIRVSFVVWLFFVVFYGACYAAGSFSLGLAGVKESSLRILIVPVGLFWVWKTRDSIANVLRSLTKSQWSMLVVTFAVVVSTPGWFGMGFILTQTSCLMAWFQLVEKGRKNHSQRFQPDLETSTSSDVGLRLSSDC